MSISNPLISIIIPTLNEEKYILNLLDSIKKQTYNNYEIIVCDSHSEDKTPQIAKSFGSEFILVDKKGPGPARNQGRKKAKGEYLLFLDADVIIPDEDFLARLIKHVEKENLGLANVFQFLHPFSVKDIPANIVVNIYFKLSSYFSPIGGGFFILVKKDVFDEANGFDESINVGEDSDFIRRTSKISNYSMLNQYIFYSNRRFELEGRLNLYSKYIYLHFDELLEPVLGKIELDYKFGHYNLSNETKKYNFLMDRINFIFHENKNDLLELYRKNIIKIKNSQEITKIKKLSKKLKTKIKFPSSQ